MIAPGRSERDQEFVRRLCSRLTCWRRKGWRAPACFIRRITLLTPVYAPVGTQASVKAVTPRQLHEVKSAGAGKHLSSVPATR